MKSSPSGQIPLSGPAVSTRTDETDLKGSGHRTMTPHRDHPRTTGVLPRGFLSGLAQAIPDAWILALALGSSLAGCGWSEGIEGDTAANLPPDTSISIAPPNLDAASFQVSFFWAGSDPDGTVEAFEWRISDNGPDGIVDREDTLALPWNRTTAYDSTFVVSADLDSFPDDVDDPDQSDGTYRWWQTHTFFVRAIDDQGARDPSPAHESFTATTIAPKVVIDYPTRASTTTCLSSTRKLTFGWTVNDPDDPLGRPDAVRYVLLDLGELPPPLDELIHLDDNECLNQPDYTELNPIALLPDEAWSRWIAYDAPNDSGRIVTLPLFDIDRRLLFAVQARDRSGAVTPTFDWNVNVRHMRTTSGKYPSLTVTDHYLGSRTFVSQHAVVSSRVIAEQPIEFQWSADAARYGGIIQSYRYGWDVQDVNDEDDPGWSVGWGLQWRSIERRSFRGGDHVFVVQVRDNSGAITRGTYNLSVVPIPRPRQQRNLLLIDDWGWQNTSSQLALQRMWLSTWTAHLEGRVEDWNAKVDILKVNTEPERCTFETISMYKSIIWFTKGGKTDSALRARIFPLDRPTYNWMQLYMKKTGNVLMTGPYVMHGAIADPISSYPVIYSQDDVSYYDWPMNAWCLEAMDVIRPAMGAVACEQQVPKRTAQCDRLITAVVPEAFRRSYPSSSGVLEDLPPSKDRLENNPLYKFDYEEFYNRNVSCRPVTISLRPCQKTMFALRAARDEIDPRTGEPFIDDPATECRPLGYERSVLDQVPIGLAITTYSSTKPRQGSEDFIWGFHPLAFDFAKTQAALVWILRDRWGLPVLN